MASVCVLCDCRHFVPNQFRKTLCLKCFHGFSAHSGKPSVRYYLARIEGGFTWEQLRLWYSNGLFDDPTKILVCAVDEERDNIACLPGSEVPFRLMSEAFSDPSNSFIPKDHVRDRYSHLQNFSNTSIGEVVDSQPAGKADEGIGFDSGGPTPSDTLEPTLAKARADDMALLFHQGTAWYFIDTNEKTQGPFSGDQMDSWFRAGYLWQKSLLIGQHGWPEFQTLEELMQKQAKQASSCVVSQASSSNIIAPTDIAEHVASTFSSEVQTSVPRHLSENISCAAKPTSEPVCTTLSENFVSPSACAGRSNLPVDHLSAKSTRQALVRSLHWQYRDEAGVEQGPFSAPQMSEWTNSGFFDDSTQLHVFGGLMPSGVWITLGELFPDPGVDATDEEISETAPFESTSFIELLHGRFGGATTSAASGLQSC